MKVFVCENNSSETSSSFMATEYPGELFTGINNARQRVWENHLRGTKFSDRATARLEKLLWTNDWKTKKC